MGHSHRVGVDIVDVTRIRGIMERNPGFTCRVFTPREIAYCERFSDPARHFAARFAVKEAAFKALSGHTRVLRFLDYEVDVEEGRPVLRIIGKTGEELRSLGEGDISISLSHERECAVALVMISREEERT